MVTNLFNGRTHISQVVRKGGDSFDIKLSFWDLTGYWTGSDAQIGDVVFVRGMDGKGVRLILTAISKKYASQIFCTVQAESPVFIQSQYCAIVRETANHQYPQFPAGIPVAIKSIMESYYAYLVDLNTEGGCKSGVQLTQNDLTGVESFCIMQDGKQKQIELSELVEYILTLTSKGGSKYRLGVGELGQMLNKKR